MLDSLWEWPQFSTCPSNQALCDMTSQLLSSSGGVYFFLSCTWTNLWLPLPNGMGWKQRCDSSEPHPKRPCRLLPSLLESNCCHGTSLGSPPRRRETPPGLITHLPLPWMTARQLSFVWVMPPKTVQLKRACQPTIDRCVSTGKVSQVCPDQKISLAMLQMHEINKCLLF